MSSVTLIDNDRISVNMNVDTINFHWKINDPCAHCLSEWRALLEAMKSEPVINHSYIGGGGNSSWRAGLKDSKFTLVHHITGCGGDSILYVDFPIDIMIPIIEQIVIIYENNNFNNDI